jgi:capsular exopolysaccharide synthesis family protein
MSINENPTQSDELSSEQAITIQPSGIAAYPSGGDWMSAGANDPAQNAGNGLAVVMHAIRRHLLLVLSIGLVSAATTGGLLYAFLPVKYSAEAVLQLAPVIPHVLNKGADAEQSVMNEFEVFRNDQAALMKARWVMIAALRDPNLKGRACVRREDDRHNAIQWLTGAISVELPTKNTGIIRVNATEADRDDAAAMVNAVVGAYWNEVVYRDRQRRENRVSELQKIHAEKEVEVRTKREQLKRELEQIGASDEETMKARAQLAVSIYAEFQREFQQMKMEKRSIDGKLKETEETLKVMSEKQIPDTEIVMLLNNDPAYRDLKGRIQILQGIGRQQDYAAAPGVKIPAGFGRATAELDAATKQLAQLKEEARGMVAESKRIALETEAQHLKSRAEIMAAQVASFEKEVEKKHIEADDVGKISISAQMMKAEVEDIERILRDAAEEQQRLTVELRSPSRVTIPGNAPPDRCADVPESESQGQKTFRLMVVILGSLLALCAPAVCIVVWDLGKERVNSANDVSKRLKIPVIGAVPLIPAAIMRRLGDATRKSQIWKLRFTESIDGVAARLLRKAECDQTRVVLITSALSGEGKTTLATQLAMSLARARRTTVLVDFDLRQPTLDGALGLPLGPGICEALRGEGDVMGMVQQTETECLSVITAGSWSRQVLPSLSSGVVGTVLEQLRANFDFVIIDSSPLLPIVDTRLVSQHVDSVVLAVLRDVSQGSAVLAAQEMLDAFGVRSIEAVVTGGVEHGNAKNLAYQTAMVDNQGALAEGEAEILEDHESVGGNPQ